MNKLPFKVIFKYGRGEAFGHWTATLGIKWRAYSTGDIFGMWYFLHPIWWNGKKKYINARKAL